MDEMDREFNISEITTKCMHKHIIHKSNFHQDGILIVDISKNNPITLNWKQ